MWEGCNFFKEGCNAPRIKTAQLCVVKILSRYNLF